MTPDETQKHTLFNAPLPKGWQILSVDRIKAKERYSCVAGPFGSSISAKYFTETGVPVIRGCNLTDDMTQFILEGFVFVSEDKAKTFPGQHVKAGDLVFTCWGTLGQVGLIPEDGPYKEYIISNKQLKLRPDQGQSDNRYLYYYFSTPQMVRHINDIAIGTAVPGINLGLLKRIKVVIPPLPTQKKIAAILSAYDDLIENNKRRIVLLEKMAEEIYCEWFVRMRFPGHKKVKFVKGLPEGWEIRPSIEVFDVLSGGTPKTDVPQFWDGEIPFFTPKDAGDNIYVLNTEKMITQRGLDTCNSQLYTKNTIFITARGTVGKLALAQKDMAMNQSCYALRQKENEEVYFYYLAMQNAISYVKGISKSGVFDNIIVDTFKVVPLLVPDRKLVQNFNKKVASTFEKISALLEVNELLVAMRDKMLPRLISGKLSVEDLDIHFPLSMQEQTATEQLELDFTHA